MARKTTTQVSVCHPIGHTWRTDAAVLPVTPPGWEMLAEIHTRRLVDRYWKVDRSILIRNSATGVLACLSTAGAVQSIDQAEAARAYAALEERPASRTEAEELAELVRSWRGDYNTAIAGEMLGLPARTIEGIEQGRAFRYPRLLVLAIRAFRSTPDPARMAAKDRAEGPATADETTP